MHRDGVIKCLFGKLQNTKRARLPPDLTIPGGRRPCLGHRKEVGVGIKRDHRPLLADPRRREKSPKPGVRPGIEDRLSLFDASQSDDPPGDAQERRRNPLRIRVCRGNPIDLHSRASTNNCQIRAIRTLPDQSHRDNRMPPPTITVHRSRCIVADR